MTRPTAHFSVRVVFVGLGVFCLGVAVLDTVSFWTHWSMTEGIVEMRPSPDRPAQMVRWVAYARANGVQSSVPLPEETLPASAKLGDRVRVAYNTNGKRAMVCTFRSVWRVPTVGCILGVALTFLGLYLRPRRKELVMEGLGARPLDLTMKIPGFFFVSLGLAILAVGAELAGTKHSSIGALAGARAVVLPESERAVAITEAHVYRISGTSFSAIGLAFALASVVFVIVSARMREAAWRSVTMALLIFYAMLHFDMA